jgi:V8-like Glu-specific endopeptidase
METTKPILSEELKKMKSVKAKKSVSNLEEIEAIAIKSLEGTKKSIEKTEGFTPESLDIEFIPKTVKNTKFIDRETFMQEKGSKTIFGPDQRTVYNSIAYPWNCVGKIQTELGVASGVMIGPRHVLTCAHVIKFLSNGNTGWVKFSPMYYNGANPTYGTANSVKTFYKYKVSGPTIDATESKFDYAVVVLDRNLGNTTGWMGATAYADSWDGGAYWTHAGYPVDLTAAERPIYQTSIALNGDDATTDRAQALYHTGDVWPGQSGGPFWGYWGTTPNVIAVQSWQNNTTNAASGGSDMVDLINQARTQFP